MTVLEGRIPDKVPHFELEFQLTREAFGQDWPEEKKYGGDAHGKKQFRKDFLDLWDKVITRFGWDCFHITYHALETDLAMIKEAKDRFGDRAAIVTYNGNGTFWMMDGHDMMDFAVRLYEDLDGILDEAKRKRDASIELARKQTEAGVDFIIINSDYGYNNGPYISPEMFAVIDTPFLKEIVDAIHSFGKKAMLHSDGDLNLILDQLVSTGLDGYQSVDPQGHMDIAEVRKKYPHLVLMGNVQCSYLQDTDEDLIRSSVRYAMNSAKPGGRYIFSSSNCIFAGMPLLSYEIMLDEYNKLAPYEGTGSLGGGGNDKA
jgi:uroporphyrinogen decarboxylase